MKARRAIPILVNLAAGRGGTRASDRVATLLEASEIAIELRAIEPRHFEHAVERARREGAPAIGVCGGDGSLHTAAQLLAGGPIALLPIPTGTLNHFARRLGVHGPEDAVRALVGGRSLRVPLGVVDDRLFLNTATFGLYADVVRLREKIRRLLPKWPAALIASLVILLRMRQLEIVVQVEGRFLRRSTPLLWVGLGWGSFPRVHEAAERRSSPDLEIVFLRPGSRLSVLALTARLVVHLLKGKRPIRDDALEIVHTRNLLIHSPHRVGITLDGELMRGEPPLFVAVQDDALEVLVPDVRGGATPPA